MLYAVQNLNEITEQDQADICASFQYAATEVLVKKISKALKDTGREGIILAGGVAANKLLREKISTLQKTFNIKVLYPTNLFPVLKAFVAPMLPEPISLISFFKKILVKIKPNGIDPIR